MISVDMDSGGLFALITSTHTSKSVQSSLVLTIADRTLPLALDFNIKILQSEKINPEQNVNCTPNTSRYAYHDVVVLWPLDSDNKTSRVATYYTLPNVSPLYLQRQADSKFEENCVE